VVAACSGMLVDQQPHGGVYIQQIGAAAGLPGLLRGCLGHFFESGRVCDGMGWDILSWMR
jgi:hypothetical protein